MTAGQKHNSTANVALPIESHVQRVEPWRQAQRGGSMADRTLSQVTVNLPPMIAGLNPAVPPAVMAISDDALREIAAIDSTHGVHLAPLATLLLRAESVASSKIEHVEASLDDYARALHGVKANAAAVSMVASTQALTYLIDSLHDSTPITLAALTDAHRTLMADDPGERHYAGTVRDMQNWIGGSDYSPRGALYVPPPPATVPSYLDDLVAFANRTDLSALTQAAIAHAQFESIHPFTDGNGRIGRALINMVLRRRGITRQVAVPLASAIVARREAYFDALTAYRGGDAGPIVTMFARGSLIAAAESRITAARLAELPDQWREMTGSTRADSAASAILDTLLTEPVFTAEQAESRIGSATSSVYAAISRLEAAGVIRAITQRARNQVWIAAAIADELEDLGLRIATRAREEVAGAG